MLTVDGYPSTKLFIDGVWRDGGTGATIDVADPSSGDVIGRVASATIADLDTALDAADRAFGVWSTTSVFDRYRTMRKAAELLRERSEAIARNMTLEQGKPLAEARVEVLAGADIIDWFAEEGRRAYGQIVPPRFAGVTQMVIKLPIGPVAAFTPWNFPINQVVRKLSAALAAGCSIIVKGPEETPAAPAALIRAFADAGVPAGVINLVYGVPAEISGHLIPHPIIRKVSFTGSTAVGRHIASLAGQHLKPATLELGGHAPAIVFADADLGEAVQILAAGKYRNAGQVCVSPTRMLVQQEAYDAFLQGFADAAQAIEVGPGLEERSRMGPLVSERRLAAVEELVSDAIASGADLVTGGRRIGNKGNFFEPTVLANVPESARIMNEEPFGPVAIVNRFGRLEDAMAEANRLPYGLASYAFTSSAATMDALGTGIAAGMTTINHNGLSLPELPFGGVRDSGYGTEGGSQAIDAYLTPKLVTRRI